MDGTVARDLLRSCASATPGLGSGSREAPQGSAPDVAALRRLRAALALAPEGTVKNENVATLVVQAWPYLHGSFAKGMCREKVAGRVLDLVWHSPVLSITITGRGTWQVDVQDASAWAAPQGEPLELPAKKDAKELALELVQYVLDGTVHHAIVRKPRGVSIRPGNVPGLDVGYAETLPGRHRRFRAALEQAMAAAGYARVAPYRFRRGERPLDDITERDLRTRSAM